jgi:hypothetical protein
MPYSRLYRLRVHRSSPAMSTHNSEMHKTPWYHAYYNGNPISHKISMLSPVVHVALCDTVAKAGFTRQQS